MRGFPLPVAIILDMRMPGMDGWEFAREYKARYDQGAPILVLRASQSAEQSAKEIGAEAFLDKPFEIDELIRFVKAMFDPQESTTVTDDETDLVTQATRGDREAFVELYDRYYDRIFRHISYRVNRVEDAEDLTQQVFLRAWAAVGRYEQSGTPFLAWLFTIAHNLLVSSYRKKPAVYMKGDYADNRLDSDPERQADIQFERERLLKAILRLSPIQQKVITMRFLDNLDHRQVAGVIGKTEANVGVIQYRALQQLRRFLEEEGI